MPTYWKAREYGFHTNMIESSMMANDRMPEYCVERTMHILNRQHTAINGAKVLVLGVAYKQDIDDYRESPAIHVIEELLKVGADVKYFDPWVNHFRKGILSMTGEKEFSAELLADADIVLVTAAHANVNYNIVQQHAQAIFDTKNVMNNIVQRNNIEVLKSDPEAI